ncbi:L-fucose/L-arabinose isomerase family protein [Cuneatibacter caecimuris]|uniref:L-fucose isomerase-like protein n=1 Tax=Cuneatibacter caecimuris TaxID=1796618 RepID=A0A4Q7PNC6_9FIRM|nr:L-fucose/L-arabinose isomerase family protein [Cuneatibacter caecimuris]RZT02442.1 L-fucose isomerase-like protein [Cuneatibacter caecimuris]
MEYHVRLGVACTRRFIFSKEDAVKYKNMTLQKLTELGIDFVDIEDINEEGLLFDESHIKPVVEKFRRAGVDALFFPHTNFGTEDLVCKVAKEMNLPVCIWGPRDEAPIPTGERLRDSQCGLFATGKVLRRFRIPFTYIQNCRLEDEAFKRGIHNFIAASNVVKEFRSLRILQISTRPAGFWTMMCNEGELLEKFGIQIHPISLEELKTEMESCADSEEAAAAQQTMTENMNVCVKEDAVKKLAAMKAAMTRLVKRYGCKAIAIQCWNAMQDALGCFPCVANSLMTEEGIPVVCETDIHGAVTAVMVQSAGMGKAPTFFADWTVRHPENDNGELLQHCGPWPFSLAKEKPTLEAPFAFNYSHPGSVSAELKGGEMSLLRFDGDNGQYSMLMGSARGIEGPRTKGTYAWVEVKNLVKLEEKIVTGPYVHHCVGIHGDVIPAVYEALKYIPGIKPDLYDDNEEEIRAFLRGE